MREKGVRKRAARQWKPYLWLMPALLLFAVFTFYPFIETIWKSLFIVDITGDPKRFVGLENYAYILSDEKFLTALKNTVLFVLMTVPISKVFGFILAILANKRRRFSGFYETSFALPMALASSVVAMIFQLLYVSPLGIVNGLTGLNIPWLTDARYALFAISVIQIWLSTGYSFVFLLSAVRSVPQELVESAAIDGASSLRRVFSIYIPLTTPTLFYLVFTDIAFGMMMMMSLVNVLTGGGPNDATMTLMQYIFRQISASGNYTNANPAAVITFFLTFVVTMATFAWEKRGGVLPVNRRRSADVGMQVICIICALMILFPILYAFSVSFMEQKDILTTSHYLLPPSPTLENYIKALTSTKIVRYMGNSFLIALICACSRVILAAMAAFAFSFYDFRGKRILFALTLATIMIPPDVLVFQNYVTISKLGLINTYAGICSIFLVSANNIFLMRQNFLTFSRGLQEAARLDGCGDGTFFFKILLPVSKPVLITVFMNSFVSVWNQYVWPMLVTNRDEMRTVQVGITMLKDKQSSAFGPVMAGVMVALFPTIIVFALFLRKIVSGMMSGAVKE